MPPADWKQVRLEDFRDDELQLPLALDRFHQVANAVVETGDNRGFIDLSIWRDQKDNKPYNARILENHVALAYFYSTHRPWNPYYASPQVRVRLEAILDRWCRIQNEQGLFAEYSPTNFSLAPTGFGVRTMSVTLELLKNGPAIDRAILDRTIAAERKGILALIQDDQWIKNGRDYTNQYSGVYAAALIFAHCHPEHADLLPLLQERIKSVAQQHQSSAGFMYEAGGPDFGYTLGTHQTNLTHAWSLAHGTPLGDALLDESRALYEWFSYGLVREPDGSGYFTNYGISCRTATRFFTDHVDPLAEFVPVSRAFVQNDEQYKQALTKRRAELAEQWGKFRPMKIGASAAYAPGVFIDRNSFGWRPTAAQQKEAIELLPYLKQDRFTHQRVDSRRPFACTFVRRPSYYAIFNSGPIINGRQRYGLGLLWNPKTGCLLQNQADAKREVWGTLLPGSELPVEAGDIRATFAVDGQASELSVGARDLPAGDLLVEYPLGSSGTKSITFSDAGVDVAIITDGPFVEQIPLVLQAGESLAQQPGQISLNRNGVAMLIKFSENTSVTIKLLETGPTAQHRFAILTLGGDHNLRYAMHFASP